MVVLCSLKITAALFHNKCNYQNFHVPQNLFCALKILANIPLKIYGHQHSYLPYAEGFFNPKIEASLFCYTLLVQKQDNGADLPQFQNAVGTVHFPFSP